MRPVKSWIAVEPYEESDMSPSGLLYIPDSSKMKEYIQGKVTAIGESVQRCEAGDYILFHPFRSEDLHNDLGFIRDIDVVCKIQNDSMVPLENDLMILPDWDSKYKRDGLIQISDIWINRDEEGNTTGTSYNTDPVMFGWVVKGGWLTELEIGSYVVVTPRKGSEAVYGSTFAYFIPEEEILGVIEDGNN